MPPPGFATALLHRLPLMDKIFKSSRKNKPPPPPARPGRTPGMSEGEWLTAKLRADIQAQAWLAMYHPNHPLLARTRRLIRRTHELRRTYRAWLAAQLRPSAAPSAPISVSEISGRELIRRTKPESQTGPPKRRRRPWCHPGTPAKPKRANVVTTRHSQHKPNLISAASAAGKPEDLCASHGAGGKHGLAEPDNRGLAPWRSIGELVAALLTTIEPKKPDQQGSC
jgi:hypothetical protein